MSKRCVKRKDPSTAKAGNPKTQGGRRHPATLRKRRQAMDIEGKRRKEGGRKASKGKAKEQGEGRRGAEATTSNPLSRSPGPIRPPEEATAHPRRDQPNVPKRKCREKCLSTTKADRNKPHGRTGQVQQGRPRLPQPDILTAQMRYLRHHVEGGSKSSCQVSPTVTGKGRSAATPNPTRLH